MTQLYFVRHGKTEYNLADRVQGGDIDSPLLLESKRDAVKTGIALQSSTIPRIIASPQHRAVETMELITNQFQHPFSIHFTEDFREFRYGDWEGASIPKLRESFPEMFYHLRERPELYNPASIKGETYKELIKRGTSVVHKACTAFPNEDILFVGHSITITCTILSLVGKKIKDLRSAPPLDNTSISIVNFEKDTFHLNTWNKTTHLR